MGDDINLHRRQIFCGLEDEYPLTNKWGKLALGQSLKNAENKRAVRWRKYNAQNAKELGAVLTTFCYFLPSKSETPTQS